MTSLIFHIGGGKTGSSSIQATLNYNVKPLEKAKLAYLGIMGENLPKKLFPWQRPGGSLEFYASSDPKGQLQEVLENAFDTLESTGITTAIMSNEWFLGSDYEYRRNLPVINAIAELQKCGRRIVVVAYVRDHLSWAASAYQQWALKHKTMNHEIPTFLEYTKSRPPRFANALDAWNSSVENFQIHNFGTIGDVTHHFLEHYCGIDHKSVTVVRTNEQPSSPELFLRTCFNKIEGSGKEVTPSEFDRLFNSHLHSLMQNEDDTSLSQWYDSLVPTFSDIELVKNMALADVQDVNNILRAHGETEITLAPHQKLASKLKSANTRETVDFLVRLCISIAQENQKLRGGLRSDSSG